MALTNISLNQVTPRTRRGYRTSLSSYSTCSSPSGYSSPFSRYLPPTPSFPVPPLPSYNLPEFPEFEVAPPPPAPLYTTPPELKQQYQNLMNLLSERAGKGIQLPPEYITNLYRRAGEQIAGEAEEVRRKYAESLAARGLAQSGIAAQAEQEIAETALTEKAKAVRDIETELMARQMASQEQAVNQLLQAYQQYGEEAFKEYASKLSEFNTYWDYLKQKNNLEYQKAAAIYGAESERARQIFLAGVQERLAAIQGNINAAIAAYEAAARLGNTALQGRIESMLNQQLHHLALEQMAAEAELDSQIAQQQATGQLLGDIAIVGISALLGHPELGLMTLLKRR